MAGAAPSMQPWPRQIAGPVATLERWLEAERDQLPLWLPVMLGGGIALWFVLPVRSAWLAAMLAAGALGLAALLLPAGGRARRVGSWAMALVAVGVVLAWARAEWVAAPVLTRPANVRMVARVEAAEPLPARDLVRLRLRPLHAIQAGGAARSVLLPPRVRVNVAVADAPATLAPGTTIRLGARLMPPPPPAVPGAYDFARVAWFAGIGATGRAHAPVTILAGSQGDAGLRARLTGHIQAQVPGSAGGIAAALATGDIGGIADHDQEAMRDSGLAHLLSVSGLHLTALVAMTMALVRRTLALSPRLALSWRLPVIAATAAGVAAIGYTWLAGAAVPTVRSCIAALMVLAALAIGREAITLRLVAVGATIVLILWPEALVGPSFQLSFAAITAIVAFHEHPRVAGLLMARAEPWPRARLRGLAGLLATGLVVEAALMPIGVFHFHQAGLYGALANIVAIPLVTFVVMPLEALALALDPIGLGWPAWAAVSLGLEGLVALAHGVATAPGAVAALPSMPAGAFAAIVGGGLWLALWRSRVRWAGAIPLALGAVWTWATPPPDLLVTGDGRHVAIRTPAGGLALLRDRAGEYTRDVLGENAGVAAPSLLSEAAIARCSRDLCVADRDAGGRRWRLLATRSAYPVPWRTLVAACGEADLVVSDRRLPRACRPRWWRLDRPALARTGGVAITLATGRVATVAAVRDDHPWRRPFRRADTINRSGAAAPRAGPAPGPAPDDSAADHRRGSPDRGGPSRPPAGNT